MFLLVNTTRKHVRCGVCNLIVFCFMFTFVARVLV